MFIIFPDLVTTSGDEDGIFIAIRNCKGGAVAEI